jgi:hypothetical protein
MNYLTGEMLNPVDEAPVPASNGTKKQRPHVDYEKHYDALDTLDALSNYEDSELTTGDDVTYPLDHRIRIRGRLYRVFLFPIAASVLVLVGGTILTAIISTKIGQLNTVLAKVQADLSQSTPSSALLSGPLSGPAHSPTKAAGDKLGHCGRPIVEARALGCVWHAMSWAWQRPECYHAELVAEFLARMDWRQVLHQQRDAT